MNLACDTLVTVEPPGPRFVPAPPEVTPVIVLPVEGPQGKPGEVVGGRPVPVVYEGTWTSALLAHSFPYPPEVWLIGNNGISYAAGYTHNDATHIYIEFPVPFSGKIVIG